LLQLEEMKLDRPSKGALSLSVLQLDNDLSSAKRSRDWDAAEGVFQRLKEATAKLESEQKAEEVFGTSDDELPDLVEGPDPRAGQNQISGLTRSDGTFGSAMPGYASYSLDGKTPSGPSESVGSSNHPGAVAIEGPGNTSEAAETTSNNGFLPVARRVPDRASREQQKSATVPMWIRISRGQKKKEIMWLRIRREVLLEELQNLHAFHSAKGQSLLDYLRHEPQSEEARVDGERQSTVSVAPENSGDSKLASEAEDTKPPAFSPDESENSDTPDINIPALYTDNDSEKKKAEGMGAVLPSDSPFPTLFQALDFESRSPLHYLRHKPQSEEPRVDGESRSTVSVAPQNCGDSKVASEAEDTKAPALSPDESENSHTLDINIPALYTDNDSEKKRTPAFFQAFDFESRSPLHYLRHKPQSEEPRVDGESQSTVSVAPQSDELFPFLSREIPTIAEESFDAMSHSTTRADNVERREIDEEVLEGEATEEYCINQSAFSATASVGTSTASVGTSRDDYSQIEEMVHQVIRDMSVPAATVVQANLPDQTTPGRRMRLLGKVVRKFGKRI
jgi:hypothetical protein